MSPLCVVHSYRFSNWDIFLWVSELALPVVTSMSSNKIINKQDETPTSQPTLPTYCKPAVISYITLIVPHTFQTNFSQLWEMALSKVLSDILSSIFLWIRKKVPILRYFSLGKRNLRIGRVDPILFQLIEISMSCSALKNIRFYIDVIPFPQSLSLWSVGKPIWERVFGNPS